MYKARKQMVCNRPLVAPPFAQKVARFDKEVQRKRGQSEIPLKKSHVSLEMTTYSLIILHEHALTSSILIQQKPRPLLLPAAGTILNLSRLMNT